ncbi:hypothetical protein K438DRAFT_1130309 [Mycena galopus ATCC 62051]|nr:hypothetical protein K438DRAFT_1130309 [Mycena galopus ATCC 62051]
MVMSLEDAIRWAVMGSRRVNLEDMYPGLPTDTERKQAWVDDNRDSIREAMTVLMVAWPDDFPSGASLDSTGSMFEMSMQNFFIPVYWKPAAIQVEYEAFEYAVSTPHHVDALYAMHDKDTAFEYLQTHYDARAPVHPRQLIVHPGWDPLTQFRHRLPCPDPRSSKVESATPSPTGANAACIIQRPICLQCSATIWRITT